VALLPDDLRQNPASGVDEPVADLKNCKVGFPSQGDLFSVGWVGVVAVFIEPLLEDFDGLLGKIAPPFAAGLGRPDRAALRVALVRGVLVGGRTRVPSLVIHSGWQVIGFHNA